ncbi:MAG TPA: lipoprotein-releasing ABC transporter permease subunit [Gammaproteobacteria bacterium]|nr:lipoprotein-releasing ABC transporter permease subunit [Gammaproteobacteria bacterium]
MFRPYQLYIGLRYTRAKRRNHFISFISAISMLGIALGVTALITVLSVMNGFEQELRTRILGMAAHVQVLGYAGGLADWRDVAKIAEANPEVIGSAPYVEAETMLSLGNRVSGTILRGVLPEAEPAVSDIAAHMLAGKLTDLKPGEYGIVLGKELATIIGAELGDKITVISPQASITPVGTLPRLRRFTVVGLFEVGMYEYDRGVALVHVDDAAKLLQLGDRVSGVRLKLTDMFNVGAVTQALTKVLPTETRVTDWTRQHANFFLAVQTEKRVMFVILALIVAVAAFNIVSTLVMVVTDKQADIAILRTLGATPGSIMAVFIVQGTIIGAFGTLIGMVGGVLLALNVETIVPFIEQLFGVHFLSPQVYYISKLPSQLEWTDVTRITGVAFLLSMLATLYPAWRASRTQPAEALRYE